MLIAFVSVVHSTIRIASAQSASGTVSGTVVDVSGAPIAGASVELSAEGRTLSSRTQVDGRYRFVQVRPGGYGLLASKPGFRPASRGPVIVRPGELVVPALMLLVDGIRQHIEVSASPSPASSRWPITGAERTLLPSTDLAALLPMLPGVVADRVSLAGSEAHQWPQFVSAGSRMLDTVWSVEGVDVADHQTGSPLGFFDAQSVESIQFTRSTNDVSKPGSGLAIEVVFPTGTNVIRSSLRGSLTGSLLEASNLRDELRAFPTLLTPAGADHTRQIVELGATLGGPVIRDRSWFWIAASRQDVRLVRQASGDERAVIAPRTLKWNWQATSADLLTGLWSDDEVRRFGVNPSTLRAPATARQDHRSARSGSPFHGLWKLEERRIFSSNAFVTARYAYYNTGIDQTSIGRGPAGISSALGESVGGTLSASTRRAQHTGAVDLARFARLRGQDHEMRFGAEWRQSALDARSTWPGDGVVAFDIAPGDRRARLYRQQAGRERLQFFDAYASDTVTADRVSLTVGMRLDRQHAQALPSSPDGNTAFPALVPAVVYPGDGPGVVWLHVSPRASATWILTADRRTALHMSVGRFVAPVAMAVAAQTNPANASAWIEFPWEDRNGDRLAQPSEVRTDLPYVAFDGFDPANPASPDTRNRLSPGMRWRTNGAADIELERDIGAGISGSIAYRFSRSVDWPASRWLGLSDKDYAVTRVLTDVLPDGSPVVVPIFAPDPQKIAANGGGKLFGSSTGYYATYHGIEATLNRRLSGGWMARATAAWNSSRSYYPGTPVDSIGNLTRLDGSSGGGALSSPMDPLVRGGQVAPAVPAAGGAGHVFLSARWQVSAVFACLLPWHVEVGGALLGRDGTPSPYMIPQRLGLDGIRNVLVTQTVDTVRLADLWNIDARLSRRFNAGRVGIHVIGDVFNVLNASTVLARERNLRSPNFDRALMTMSPRIVRLGVRLQYR